MALYASLYQLTQEYLELLEMVGDPETPEDTLADTMEAVAGELEIKAENYAKIIKILEGDISTVDTEAKRLQARKKALEGNVERMKKALEESMKATGLTKFKTPLFSFGIQKNPERVVIDPDIDIKKVPLRFRVIADPTIDKKALKEELKAGKSFKWAHLEQSESLRIR